ncbi:MAG: hypothetical protein ABEI06_04495 [Halobacteriaceae archaeon]
MDRDENPDIEQSDASSKIKDIDESNISEELKESIEEHHEEQAEHGGLLRLSDEEAYVGDTITIEGYHLPKNQELELYWQSTEGQWGVIKANEVIGPQYHPRTDRIDVLQTDDSGEFKKNWTIPEDYGGAHTIEVRSPDGETLAEAKISITPWFEIADTEVTLGETMSITGYGIGPNFLTNNYQISWDNGMVGFMTGVKNRGTATARFRAVGPPGKHVVQVWRCYNGVPYLQNNTQSPYGPVAGGRQSIWTVEVTEPETPPEPSWVDPLPEEDPISIHYPELDVSTDAKIDITPNHGQPGANAVIQGKNFPAEEEVNLVWYRHEGEHVQGIPVSPEPKPDVLPSVMTNEDGRFSVEVTIPEDVGSTRPITAKVNDQSVAVTGFMMQPSIVNFSPTKGPVGTEIEIEISGIGWTEYEMAPFVVYDNKFLGYMCGQDLATKRTILPAAGEPGYHFIDIYPTMFPDLQTDELDFDTKPHLSYENNHPVRQLPALHFAFEITE